MPYEHDGKDAAAVIDWISQQPWSDGRVAMLGYIASVIVLSFGASFAEEFICLIEQPVAERLPSIVPAPTQSALEILFVDHGQTSVGGFVARTAAFEILDQPVLSAARVSELTSVSAPCEAGRFLLGESPGVVK